MKIHTYYEDIKFHKQDELLSLWEFSWQNQGFETSILGKHDAEKSPLYQEYYEFVQRVHINSVGKEIPEGDYHLAAQREIAAFHTIEEPSFFSDYDVINKNYKGEIAENKVHWRDAACSCFVSGGSEGWEEYIKFLFDSEESITKYCKEESSKTRRRYFHDQDFLIPIYERGRSKNIFKGTRTRPQIADFYNPEEDNSLKQIIHFAHNNIAEIKSKNPKYRRAPQDELRIEMVKQFLAEQT